MITQEFKMSIRSLWGQEAPGRRAHLGEGAPGRERVSVSLEGEGFASLFPEWRPRELLFAQGRRGPDSIDFTAFLCFSSSSETYIVPHLHISLCFFHYSFIIFNFKNKRLWGLAASQTSC